MPIGLIVSCGKATLHELDTVYSLEDEHELIDIIAIDQENEYIANKPAEGK